MMEKMKTSIVVVAAAALLVAVVSVGYLGGWWLQKDATDRSGSITNRSFARQNALREDALDKQRTALDIDVQLNSATEEQKPALRAQRTAVVSQFCNDVSQMVAAQITPMQRGFATEECN